MTSRRLLLTSVPLPLLFSLGGCYSTSVYQIAAADLARAQSAATPTGTLIPVLRQPDGRPVRVVAGALRAAQTEAPAQAEGPAQPKGPETEGPAQTERPAARIKVRVYNPGLTAAVVLTGIGSAISVAGSIAYFATLGQDPAPQANLVGAVIALSAEPIMWVGTVLWPLSIMRPAHERK